MALAAWLTQLVRRSDRRPRRQSRTAQTQTPGFRPVLESLEDRVVPSTLKFTSAPGTTAWVNAQYSYTPKTTDSPVIALQSGPAGMTLNAGTITFTPTPAQQNNAFTVDVRATEGTKHVDQIYTLTVNKGSAPSITSAAVSSPQKSYVGVKYSLQLTASGGPPPTWSVVTGPGGMTVSSKGLVTFTPTSGEVGNNQAVDIRATNVFGTADQQFLINVIATGKPSHLAINSPTFVTGAPTYLNNFLLATFQDASGPNGKESPNPFTATIDWGDGTTSGAVHIGQVVTKATKTKPASVLFEIFASHTYAPPPPSGYTITVTVDGPLGSQMASKTIKPKALLVF
jgi:hypothetical protein